MTAKYEPLTRLLAAARQRPVTITFTDLDALVGGLPPSARAYPKWWGNRHDPSGQSSAWAEAGYVVAAIRLGVDVTFEAGVVTPAAERREAAPILDGIDQLTEVLTRAGYPSIVAAVAEHSVFLHPDTVAQARGLAVFPTSGGWASVGEFDTLPDGRRVMLDDNLSPTVAFTYATNLAKGRDVQFNHVWPSSKDPDAYTALWNLFATPAFLAKPTDTGKHPAVRDALRFRAFDLYRQHPAGQPDPLEPPGYRDLVWAAHPDPVPDLEALYAPACARRPRAGPRSPAGTLGWLFSGGKPDSTI